MLSTHHVLHAEILVHDGDEAEDALAQLFEERLGFNGGVEIVPDLGGVGC